VQVGIKGLMAVIALALVTSAPANMFVNGDFEQPLDVGWQQDTFNLAGYYSFDRWDTLGQPTPGYAGRVYKYLAYYASLGQTADVPDANVTLTFDARLQLAGGSSTCWPTGAVIVSYLDAGGTELGTSMIILRNEYNTWRESDTLKFHDVQVPGEWTSYELNVAEEIADFLPGVNAADVHKVRIQLYSYTNGT
jgi:hypothetical protein